MGTACDAGKVAPEVDDDGNVGKFGVVVPTVGEARSLSRLAPSRSPEMRSPARRPQRRPPTGADNRRCAAGAFARPKNRLFARSRYTRGGGRVGGTSGPRFSSHRPRRALRGRIFEAGVTCDVGEAAPIVDDDGNIGTFGVGGPAVEEERSLSRKAPSKPREMRMVYRGWHARAVSGGKGSNDASGLGD